jgi:hypothetical protein
MRSPCSAALVANGGVALMLYRFRDGDANMRSVWICSRNDAIGFPQQHGSSTAPKCCTRLSIDMACVLRHECRPSCVRPDQASEISYVGPEVLS